MKIFVLIVNYKRHPDTISCVNALLKSDLPPNSQIILIDNTEDNSSAKILRAAFPKLKLIKNRHNLGFAKANNKGIRLALKNKATHVLILNPDVLIPNNFFTPILNTFKLNRKTGLAAPALKHQVNGTTYYGFDGFLDWTTVTPKHASARKISKPKILDSQFLTFACVLIKSNVLKKIGLLDERYFMYFEDLDFCLRASKAGFKLYLDQSTIADHQTSASFSHPRHKLKINFLSHLKFINKWLPFPRNLPPLIYHSLHYPYLYLLWTYHHWKYSQRST